MRPIPVTFLAISLTSAAAAPAAQLPEIGSPPTAQVELGRLLFWDPILSGEQDVACVTCHHPRLAYADGRDLSLGPRGQPASTPRA